MFGSRSSEVPGALLRKYSQSYLFPNTWFTWTWLVLLAFTLLHWTVRDFTVSSSVELWFHDWCKLIQVQAATERICPTLPLPQLHPYLVLALVLMGHGQVNWELVQLKTYSAKTKWCLTDLGKLLCVFSNRRDAQLQLSQNCWLVSCMWPRGF